MLPTKQSNYEYAYKNPFESDDENSQSNTHEKVELTRKQKTEYIPNEVHIAPFKIRYNWCSFCCDHCKCCCQCNTCSMICECMKCSVLLILLLIGLAIIVAATLSILYGGYLVVLEGTDAMDYAESFDIIGDCMVTHAEEEETETESCSTDANGHESCTTSTSYTSYYDYYVLNDYLEGNFTNLTDFTCSNGSRYSDSESGHLKYSKGDIIDCYTNKNCHDVYITEYNEHHTAAVGIFIGAALIFCVDLCCVVGCFVATGYGCLGWAVICCDGMSGHRFRINCECLCICCQCYEHYQVKREQKERYYRREWGGIGSRKQCHYILGYWTRKEQSKFDNNDIIEIVVKYYTVE